MSEDGKKELLKIADEERVKLSEMSLISGIARSSLSDWQKARGSEQKEELRGVAFSASQEFIEFICSSADEYRAEQKRKKRIKIKSFMRWLRGRYVEEVRYFNCEKSRRLITDILIANSRYEEKPQKGQYSSYYPRLQRFYPNAQLVLDGKEKEIEVLGERHTFNIETMKDIYSDAITSYGISDEENGEIVAKVITEHIEKHGLPLSILHDNSSSNLSQEVRDTLQKYGEIIPITCYKGHPQTDGVIEGEFGLFEQMVGEIKIEGPTKKAIAQEVLDIVFQLYTMMRNSKPRCSVCNRIPLDLMNYQPTYEEREKAEKELNLLSERSKKLKEETKPLPEKEQLITDVIERNRLAVEDSERFRKGLLKYDIAAIREAEEAFYTYSRRDSFSETKRTGKYFFGIVKNKQRAIDSERDKELKKEKYLVDQKWQRRREEYERYKEEKENKKNLKKYPDEELVKWVINAQISQNSVKMVPGFFYEEIKKCLVLISKKGNIRKILQKVKNGIMKVCDFSLEQRINLVKITEKWILDCKQLGPKSVTVIL